MFDLFAGLTTADPLSDAESAGRVFDALKEYAPAAFPDRWGYFEPLSEHWTDATVSAENWLDEMVSWRTTGSKERTGSLFPVNRFSKQPRASVALFLDRADVDPAGVREWLRALAGPLRADHGYFHIASDRDAVTGRRTYGSMTAEDDGFDVYESAQTISQGGIAELLWGTILGPAYVRLIGAETIRSAPAAVIEEWAPDTYWLQVTDQPTDPLNDWPAFDTARQKIKNHLGTKLFWNIADNSPRLIPDWNST